MKDETFLEIMNSFLMTGEVPNLFPKVCAIARFNFRSFGSVAALIVRWFGLLTQAPLNALSRS